MTVTEAIRKHLLESRGLVPRAPLPDLESLKKSEWSSTFEQMMRTRLFMGALRYGLLNSRGKPQYDRMRSARQRIALYEETGNLEILVDVANMMLLEFEEGQHPLRHIRLQDDGLHTEVKQ